MNHMFLSVELNLMVAKRFNPVVIAAINSLSLTSISFSVAIFQKVQFELKQNEDIAGKLCIAL